MEDVGKKYRESVKKRRGKWLGILLVILIVIGLVGYAYYQLIQLVWVIGNTSPTITLLTPYHNQTISTDYVNFTWESSDADGDTLYHFFMLDVISSMNSPLFEGHHTGQQTYYNYTNISDGVWWWKVEVSDLEDYTVSETRKVIVKKNTSNHFPKLLDPIVFPHEGTPQTTFTYYVTYLDLDNDAPSYVRVYIDGTSYDMEKVNVNDTNYSLGVKYKFSTSGLGVGNHTYAFYASDGQAVVSTEVYNYPIVYAEGSPQLNHLPEITLISPKDGSVLTSRKVTFRWSTTDIDGNLVREELCLYKESLESPREVYDISSGSTLELKRGTYYWKVIAYDTYSSNESEVWSFFVDIPGKQNKITIQPDSTKQYRGGKFTGKLIITNEGSTGSYEVYWYMYLKKDDVIYASDSGAIALSTTSEVDFRLDVPNTAEVGNYTIEAYTYDKPLTYEDANPLGHDSIEVEVISSEYLQVPSNYVIPISVLLVLVGIALFILFVKYRYVHLFILGLFFLLMMPLVYHYVIPTVYSISGLVMIVTGLIMFFSNDVLFFELKYSKVIGLFVSLIGVVLYMTGVMT